MAGISFPERVLMTKRTEGVIRVPPGRPKPRRATDLPDSCRKIGKNWRAGASLEHSTMHDPTDNLSPAGRNILALDASSAYEKLVVGDADGNPRARSLLEAFAPEHAVVGAAPGTGSPSDAAAVVSALWLWHDWLDESHKISQK